MVFFIIFASDTSKTVIVFMLNPIYSPASDRYENGMRYRRSGRSGVLLPEVSLGLWHNFGDVNPLSHSLAMAHYAFDHGITHFDLANNYGPSYGSAEETFGFIMKKSFKPYRDELFVSTKAGYDMWPGPYGNWGSRKSLMASLDQSLVRMGLDYVDVFYSHRYDPETPLEETMQALVDIVRQGKALYVGFPDTRPTRPKRLTVIWKRTTCIACCIRALQPVRPRSGRGGHFGTGPGVRGWVYCFFTVGARFAHVPLSARRARRFAYGTRAIPETRGIDRGDLGENQSLGPGGRRAGADVG